MITTALLNILKLFLPSWNFFNDFSTSHRLDERTIRAGHESDWQPIREDHSTRSIGRLFFNSSGNLELLENTFIDRAAQEIAVSSAEGVKHFEQGALHDSLVRILRRRIGAAQAGDEFQFRLVSTNPSELDAELFVSSRYPARKEIL
jgi:hypothetical protein